MVGNEQDAETMGQAWGYKDFNLSAGFGYSTLYIFLHFSKTPVGPADVLCFSLRSFPSIWKHVKKYWCVLIVLSNKMRGDTSPWVLPSLPFQTSKTSLVAAYASALLLKAYNGRRYEPQHTSSKVITSPGLETHHQTPHGSKLGVWLLYKTFRLHRLFLVFIVLHSTHYYLSS
jgi:hypothetical protein